MNAIQVITKAVTSQNTLALNGPIDVSIFGMIGSGHLYSYLKTWLSILADLIMFMNSVIRRVVNQRIFIATIAQFVKSTVHDKV